MVRVRLMGERQLVWLGEEADGQASRQTDTQAQSPMGCVRDDGDGDA